MSDELEAFVSDLLADTDLPEADKEAFKKTLAHEKVSKKVRDATLRQSDYSRKMDEVAKLEKEKEAWWKEREGWVNQQVTADHNNAAAWKAIKDERDRYKTALGTGELDDEPKEPQKTPQYLTKEELQEQAGLLLKLSAKMPKIALKHFREYGDELDTEGLVEFCQKNNYDLDRGYGEFTLELRKQKAEKDVEDKVKKAVEAKEKELMGKYRLPVIDNKPTPFHPFINPGKPTTKQERKEAFAKELAELVS